MYGGVPRESPLSLLFMCRMEQLAARMAVGCVWCCCRLLWRLLHPAHPCLPSPCPPLAAQRSGGGLSLRLTPRRLQQRGRRASSIRGTAPSAGSSGSSPSRSSGQRHEEAGVFERQQ